MIDCLAGEVSSYLKSTSRSSQFVTMSASIVFADMKLEKAITLTLSLPATIL